MQKVTRIGVFFLLIMFLGASLSVVGQNNYVKTVVIDAGHGGKDPGALGKIYKEKDLALAIALKTGNYIKKYLPDVKVIYTRSDDRFIELHNRAKIANDAKADLFISIHCDAFSNHSVRGSSTYVMGLHKSAKNLEVAKKENAAILLEDDYEKNYGGFDPNSLEGYIALAMSQTGFRDHSIAFAKSVQDQMRERVGMKDRSVKEAGFMVLYMTAMPGVLIETGFISNGTEEKFLGSKEGQSYIASAIFRAVRDYKNSVEKGNARTIKVEEKKDPVVVKEKKDNNSTPTKEEKTPEEKKPVNTESNDKQAGNEPKVKETKEVKPKPVVVKKEEQVKDSSTKDEVYFAIQVKSHSKPLSLNHPSFKGRKDVFEYKHNGYYKYAVGKTVSYSKAFALMKELRRGEFKDAFLIAFNNKSRIPAEKARELLKKN